jgi:hypothetical protein
MDIHRNPNNIGINSELIFSKFKKLFKSFLLYILAFILIYFSANIAYELWYGTYKLIHSKQISNIVELRNIQDQAPDPLDKNKTSFLKNINDTLNNSIPISQLDSLNNFSNEIAQDNFIDNFIDKLYIGNWTSASSIDSSFNSKFNGTMIIQLDLKPSPFQTKYSKITIFDGVYIDRLLLYQNPKLVKFILPVTNETQTIPIFLNSNLTYSNLQDYSIKNSKIKFFIFY